MLPSNPYWSSTFYIGKLRRPWASLEAQLVKNPPAMQETWVQSLGWEDPLEKGKATRSSILAWRIPWTVKSMGSQRAGHNWATFSFTFTFTNTIKFLFKIRVSQREYTQQCAHWKHTTFTFVEVSFSQCLYLPWIWDIKKKSKICIVITGFSMLIIFVLSTKYRCHYHCLSPSLSRTTPASFTYREKENSPCSLLPLNCNKVIS